MKRNFSHFVCICMLVFSSTAYSESDAEMLSNLKTFSTGIQNAVKQLHKASFSPGRVTELRRDITILSEGLKLLAGEEYNRWPLRGYHFEAAEKYNPPKPKKIATSGKVGGHPLVALGILTGQVGLSLYQGNTNGNGTEAGLSDNPVNSTLEILVGESLAHKISPKAKQADTATK